MKKSEREGGEREKEQKRGEDLPALPAVFPPAEELLVDDLLLPLASLVAVVIVELVTPEEVYDRRVDFD